MPSIAPAWLMLLPWLDNTTTLQDQPVTLTVLSTGDVDGQDGVKLSFFGGLSIARVGEPEPSSDGVALVAAPLDLLATTLKALLQRAERKDHDDVAVLLASGLRPQASPWLRGSRPPGRFTEPPCRSGKPSRRW